MAATADTATCAASNEMVSTEDEVDYGSDFEEASDEDGCGRKGLHGEVSRSMSRKLSKSLVQESSTLEQSLAQESVPAELQESVPVEVPTPGAQEMRSLPPSVGVPERTSTAELSGPRAASEERGGLERPPAPGRPSSYNAEKRPGRRRTDPEESCKSVQPDLMEMNVSTGSGGFGTPGSTGSRRPVRAKISLTNESELPAQAALPRSGTGDSSNKSGPSRPMWLQHDENLQRNLPRHVSPNRGEFRRGYSGELSQRSGGASGSRPKRSDTDPAAVPGRGRPPMDPDFDAEGRSGTADGDQRKVKRLQQEVQRLTQRLKEAELFSAQDDGLPLFTLDEVEVSCQIAQGGFSSVHHATWRSTRCALKKIFDPVITAELRAEFENEVKMLRRLRHPNVITLMAVCRQPPALSILTEFVGGGSLFELLHGPPQAKRPDSIECEPANLLPVMLQTSSSLAYLHAMLVVHRDVKSHNVLLTPGRFPVAKLCDFGLARSKSELCTGTMQWAGTASYMAPELFAKRRYTEVVDVFAFGVMLWETMSTEIPHANMEAADIAHRVQAKDGAGLPVSHGWPKTLKALLRTSMAVQAEDRPSMASVSEQLRHIIMEFPPPD